MDNTKRLTALIDEVALLPSETPWIELKINNFDPKRIGTLISALSNAARLLDQACGYVIWGIDDDHHRVVGTKFHPADMSTGQQPLELWLAQQLSPSVNFSFKEIPHADGRLVMLEIPAANLVPTKFQNIPYIRIGSTTPKLADFPDREAALQMKLRPYVWEMGPAKSFLQAEEIFSLLDVPSYFSLTQQPISGSNEDILNILAHDKIVTHDFGSRWNISNLGAILFAKNLEDFDTVSRKAVRVIRYEGDSRTGSTQSKTGVRGYAVGFQGLVEYTIKRLPAVERISGALRVARPVYPDIAIRELIANALIHQDMTITGAGPMVEIFANRVEVSNPGAPLVETNRFIDFPPRSRNEGLAALMRRIGVCEEQGSGIDKVVSAVERARLPAPDFRSEGSNTMALLPGPKHFRDMTPEERIRGCYHHCCLQHIANRGMTNSSLRERFGIAERNKSQISRVIKQTIEAGLVRPSTLWSTRGGHYEPFWA